MLIDAIASPFGISALIIFLIAYALVISEEFTQLRKSKPVVLAAGLIWMLAAYIAKQHALSLQVEAIIKENIEEYGELFLFLFVAMTYVNVMQERQIFAALRCWLVNRNYNFRKLFWITGILAFFLSPIVDNLTTALIMCAVILAVGKDNKQFVGLSCINIVVAANAGGVFSPFGDITTLIIWQSGKVATLEFLKIFVPAAISYLLPVFVMSLFIAKTKPAVIHEKIQIAHGGRTIVLLFGLTIITAVVFKVVFNLPPVIGMMTGLAYLQFYSYYMQINQRMLQNNSALNKKFLGFDLLKSIETIEWDTLIFFYGIILCIGGLTIIGYLEYLSRFLYTGLDFNLTLAQQATPANVILGLLSAILGNIPIVYAVLAMDPAMSHGQWLLITLTAGIGGSVLSIGSAAGVALMGQARQDYTFFTHLKWTPLILLGYAAGIAAHLILNRNLF